MRYQLLKISPSVEMSWGYRPTLEAAAAYGEASLHLGGIAIIDTYTGEMMTVSEAQEKLLREDGAVLRARAAQEVA